MLLVDVPESGTVDWDALGFRCREPFFTSTLKARKKSRAKASVKKRGVQGASPGTNGNGAYATTGGTR